MAIEVLLIIFTALLLLYVRAQFKGRKSSKMYWKRNKRNSAIVARCQKLKGGFQPTFWASNPHIQTLLACAGYFFKNKFQFRKEMLQMRDGGTISLDWYKQNNYINTTSNKNITGTKPLLLISVWVVGPDIEEICFNAAEQGYQPIIYRSRGDGIPLTSKRLAAYLDSADFSEAIDYLHTQNPFSDIFAIGYSLACAPILGYLGVKGKSSLITSAAFISTALDLESMLNSGLKMPYHQIITEHFKQMIFRNRCIHPFMDIGEVEKGSSLYDIFEHGHSVIHPCTGLADYIKINNPISYVSHIRTPTLFINSTDDPVLEVFIPAHLILKNNNYCIEVMTDDGGHCGFTEGIFATSWANDVALEFHAAALQCRGLLLSPIKHGCKRSRSVTR